MKLSTKLSLSILVTGILSVFLLSLLIYKFSYDSIIKSQFSYTKSIVDEVSDDINILLHEKIKTVMTMANVPVIKNQLAVSNSFYANLIDDNRNKFINSSNQRWKSIKNPSDKFIREFTENNISLYLKDQQAVIEKEYGEIFLTNKYGALVASTSKLSTFAHGHKYWWKGAYNNGQGQIYFDDRGYDESVGDYVLGLVVPIKNGTEIIGLLKCNLSILSSVNRLISGNKDKLLGKIKLVRSGGKIIIDNVHEPLSALVHNDVLKSLQDKNSESILVNNAGDDCIVGFSEIELTKGSEKYGFGGTFESIDHTKGNTGESWYVICCREIRDVQSPIIDSIKRTIFISVGVIILLIFLSSQLGKIIAKPISSLIEATEKLGKGDFSYRIKGFQKDEFARLSDAFNTMASKLQQTTTSISLLKESEDKYRSIFENAIEGFFQNTPEGQFINVNPAFANMLGYTSPEELISNIKDIYRQCYVNQEDRILFEKQMKQNGKVENLEFKAWRKDGSQIWVSTSARMIYDNDGKVSHHEGNVADITERILAEEELKKLSIAIKQSPVSIILTDRQGNIEYVNPKFCSLTGYSKSELMGKNPRILQSGEMPKRIYEQLWETILDGKEWRGEFQNKKKNGELYWEDVIISPVIDDRGNIINFLAVKEDITKKKQIEKNLEHSENRYQQLVENISELVWELDSNGRYIYISPKCKDVYGLASEIIIGKTPFEFMPAGEAERVHHLFNEIQEMRNPFLRLENIAQHADGRLLNMETTGFPFFDDAGNFQGYRGTAIDITERKQNQKAIQAIVEGTVGKIGEDLFDSTIVRLSEWLGCNLAFIGEIVEHNTIKSISMMLDGEFVSEYSYPFKGKGCKEKFCKCFEECHKKLWQLLSDDPDFLKKNPDGYINTPLKNREGRTIGVLCCISRQKLKMTNDAENVLNIISARVSAEIESRNAEREKMLLETKLQQSQKMESIGTLAGGIAHDFNNILSSIIGFTDLAIKQVEEGTSLEDDLQEVYSAGMRAKELVRQILVFARKSEDEPLPIKPFEIANEVLKFIRSSIPANIEIKDEIFSKATIIGNSTQLHQVLMNLLTNAAQAMEDNGGVLKFIMQDIVIEERTYSETIDLEPGNYIEICISDTGVGIPEDLIKSIFEPYFTTKEQGEGTGLGLAVVHGIIENYKGKISVKSILGEGTIFNIYLPTAEKQKNKKVSAKYDVPTGNEKILFVDDEPSITKMGRRLLEGLGYHVVTCNDSMDALEMFRKEPMMYDLVITDTTMPKMTGDKLAMEMLKIREDLPIMLCTGYNKKISQQTAREIGIKAFGYKPLVQLDLAKIIRNLLDGKT